MDWEWEVGYLEPCLRLHDLEMREEKTNGLVYECRSPRLYCTNSRQQKEDGHEVYSGAICLIKCWIVRS